ncbi:MAG: arginine biosynthesis protein ArgJ, partial [Firmicutes bacterium HGW-Firmicutes-21]
MKFLEGGVCAPKGFLASGIHCGIRRNKQKKDLSLIYSEKKAVAAAVYTRNLVKGAPIFVTQKNLEAPYASAIICNSGNANTCNANGREIAERMCALTAEELGILPSDIIIASTGVIGQPLDINPIKDGLPAVVGGLSENGSDSAAEGIMTTDTVKKEVAVSFSAGGKLCTVGGIAKGSGMIHPNMATMLVFLTTDIAISPALLQKALSEDTENSFNMISIDGDTSTNDMACILANGMAGND